jgi:hypothetical protein
MKKRWDKNQWQGRTRKQVEDTTAIISWTIVVAAVVIALISIYYVLTGKL